MYPAGAPPKADALDARTLSRRLPRPATRRASRSASGSARPEDIGRHRGRDLPVLRRHAGRRQRARSRSSPTPCARRSTTTQRLAQFLPPDARGLGRRVEQQVADLRQGRADPRTRRARGRWPSATRRRWPSSAGRTACPQDRRGVSSPFLPFFWGIWNFRQEQVGGQEPAVHLSQPASIEKLVAASGGLRPAARSPICSTLKTWAEEGPPKGTLYHYPEPAQPPDLDRSPALRRRRRSPCRSTRRRSMTKMAVRHMQGERDGEDAGVGRERGRRLHARRDRGRSRLGVAVGVPQQVTRRAPRHAASVD